MKLIAMKAVVLTAFLFIVSGCSSVKVIHTQKDPSFALIEYKTFDFLKIDLDLGELPEFETRVEWIKDEIEKQMRNKGLNRSSNNPDLLVNIGIVVEEKVQTRETDLRTDAPIYIGQRNYHWESETVEVGRYHEGTVYIDLVDRDRNRLVWQGIASGVVVKSDEKSKQNIAAGGEKLFSTLE